MTKLVWKVFISSKQSAVLFSCSNTCLSNICLVNMCLFLFSEKSQFPSNKVGKPTSAPLPLNLEGRRTLCAPMCGCFCSLPLHIVCIPRSVLWYRKRSFLYHKKTRPPITLFSIWEVCIYKKFNRLTVQFHLTPKCFLLHIEFLYLLYILASYGCNHSDSVSW